MILGTKIPHPRQDAKDVLFKEKVAISTLRIGTALHHFIPYIQFTNKLDITELKI